MLYYRSVKTILYSSKQFTVCSENVLAIEAVLNKTITLRPTATAA